MIAPSSVHVRRLGGKGLGPVVLARLARGVGAVAIAGVLVFAVPVTSQALVAPVPVGQFVLGAVRAAAPLEAAASTVGPEGTLIVSSVVALAALAYVTKDTWMPWVSGLFGASGPQSAPDTTHSGSAMVLSLTVDPAPGGVWVLTETNTDGSRSLGSLTGVTVQCKVNGVVAAGVWHYKDFYMGPGSSQTDSGQCPSGGTLVNLFTEYVYSSDSRQVNGTINQVSWGTPFDARNDATYRVDNTCLKPDGSSAVISATTVNPGAGGLLVPSCAQAFGPDTHSTGWKVNGAPTGGTPKELSSTTIPQTSALYPNCVGAGVACTYVVEYNGVACVVGQTECTDWTRRDALGIGGQYQCKFGAYSVAIGLCAVDERVYEPGGVALTAANTDGSPWTYDAPVPAWAPAPAADPAAPPAGAPGGAPAPIPVTPLPNAAPAPTTTTDCYPTGMAAWNPVDWVQLPMQCALRWAFVPTNISTTPIGTQLDRAGIAPSIAALSTTVATLGGDSGGCSGPSIPFDIGPVHQVITPFAACTAPMSTVAGYAYALISVMVVVGGAGKIISLIAHGFGYGGPPPTWQQGTLF